MKSSKIIGYWPTVHLAQLPQIAKEIWTHLPQPCLVGLQAEIGSGKTTLVKTLLAEAQIDHFEGSPTFSIVQSYLSPNKGPIYHLDCYRIEGAEEIPNLGLEELLDENAYFFIEWPQNSTEILPNQHFWLYIRSNADQSREITLCHDH
jgi:tRNA threonylcarbamoyladenosine biosynthesis protein TsaE